MRLTSNNGGQVGSAILNTPIDTSETFTVDFDYDINGDADGMSMFLIDGAEAAPAPGAGGGSLGYLPGGTTAGAASGYVGIGFTEYLWAANGGAGIRLMGSGSGTTGYAQIASKADSVATSSGHAHVIFDHGVVTLDIASGRVFDHVDLTAVAGQAALPSTVKLGFVGATGGLAATHQIRNVSLDVQSDSLHVAPSITWNSQNGEVFVSADLTNVGPNALPDAQLAITGATAVGPDWTCTAVASATCPVTTSGPIEGISLPAGGGQVTVTQQVTGAVRGSVVSFLLSSASDPTLRRTEVQQLSYPYLGFYGDTVPSNSSANVIPVYGIDASWSIESTIANHGTVTVAPDSASLLYTPDAGYVGTDTVTFSVRNGHMLATNYWATMTVLDNARPTATWTAPPSVAHASTIDIPLTLADVDGDIVTVNAGEGDGGCTTVIDATLTYDPRCGGKGGFAGTDTVYFTITDGNYSVNYQFDVEVTDQAPTASFMAPTSVGHRSSIDIPLTFADVDGDIVTVDNSRARYGCAYVIDATLTYDTACEGDFTGTDTVYFTISDGALSVDYEFDIEVLGPSATTAAATVQEGKTVTIPVTLSDPSGHSLTLVDPGSVLVPRRTLVSETVGPNGTYTVDGSNLVYTPHEGYVGDDVISYSVIDDLGIADNPYPRFYGGFIATVTVTANHAPTATVAAASVETGSSVTIPVTLADADGDAVELSGAEALHGGVVIDGSNLVYTPAAGYIGQDEISFSLADYMTGGNEVVAVTVRPLNSAPTPPADEDGTPEISGAADDDLSLVIEGVTDTDGDTLVVDVTTQPAHGTVSLEDAAPQRADLRAALIGVNGVRVIYTPNAGFSGTDSFTYRVSDGHGGSYSRTVTVNVLAVATAPAPVAAPAAPSRPASGKLPATGGDAGMLLGLATVALLAGLGLLGVSRRKNAG